MKPNAWIRYLFPFFLTLFFGFLLFMLAQFREPPGFRWYGLLWFAITVYAIWEAGWYVGNRLDVRLPWRQGTFKRLLVQLLQTNLWGILIYLTTFSILNTYENYVRGNDNPLSLFHLMVSSAQAILIIQIINSIQIGYQLLNNWQKVQMEAEQTRKSNAINKLENIRQAFDRHFLLDHLSELEAVMQKSPKEATQYLQKISEAYNSNLDRLDIQLEGVQEELMIPTLPPNFLRKEIEKPSVPTNKSRFLVRSGPKFTVVPTEQVAGFFKDDLVLLVTMTGKKYVVDKSLEELLGKLPANNFYRINRQCIINIAAIQEARPEGTQLQLTLSVDFPKPLYVSQRNVASFKKWLDEEGR